MIHERVDSMDQEEKLDYEPKLSEIKPIMQNCIEVGLATFKAGVTKKHVETVLKERKQKLVHDEKWIV